MIELISPMKLTVAYCFSCPEEMRYWLRTVLSETKRSAGRISRRGTAAAWYWSPPRIPMMA